MERDGGPYGLRIRYHAGRALSPVAVLYARSPSDCGQYPRGPLQLAIPRRSLGSGLFYLYHFQLVDIHLLILARMRMVVDDICGYVSRLRHRRPDQGRLKNPESSYSGREVVRLCTAASPRLEAVDDVAIVTRGRG